MTRPTVPVYIVAAGAASALGFGWHGIGAARTGGAKALCPSRQLEPTHGRVLAAEVPPIPDALDVAPRLRKLMSHPARLAAAAIRSAMVDAAWGPADLTEAALYLGVGASGGATADLENILGASIVDGHFSGARFNGAGLAACNPLYAFQLMNNFTLCHGAIANGVGGPNGAFFSRGTGTVAALAEAHAAVGFGTCEHAFAGGADSALHPVTWDGLKRGGFVGRGLVPGEGAAVLALAATREAALARLEHVEQHSEAAWLAAPAELPRRAIDRLLLGAEDRVLVDAWGPEPRQRLQHAWQALLDPRAVQWLDGGEALAATPALAWVAALDKLRNGTIAGRAVVVTAGIDGGFGVVVLQRAS